ncbi:PilZ domain-containing protein [Caulobacter sp. D4A]|uniref:PilZ domain-containing protein n=1 Tax=unclassified Caulobacter TaxID=2648921 RepID=UPI000D72B07B|nr:MULTISPECIES: PilZ domain-containing protein [unclassified Caulobacter]PXA78040.1 PilZ domain-containing protein [Caulobacter sp. D4A]PXA92217.1 PilZ domain-containing protein [Caulobacter sp. D5]
MSQIEVQGMEKRAYRRYPASRKAYLVVGGEPLRCRLIDIAKGGARIAGPELSPQAGPLHLVDPARRLVHLTRMVWQGDGQMGLQFIESRAFTEALGGAEGAGRVVDMIGPWPTDG